MKLIIFLVTYIFLLTLSNFSLAEVTICNQLEGNEFLSDGLYDQAFLNLKGCEDDLEVTGLSLGQLALLYGWLGYGDFDSPEARTQKVYHLYLFSALKGNEDSISTLIQIYENGEPLTSLVAERDKAFCLRALVDSGDYTLQQVNDCIGYYQ